MKKILLDSLASFRASLRNSTTYASSPRGLLLIPLILVCFALSPQMQALSPPPDGGYPNGNTAEGDSALSGLTGGFYNSGVGFLSLLSNGDASFNTGVGAGVLLLNTANENTAIGAGALFSNTTGSNTAVGSFAMFTNTIGGANTAIGFHTMLNNVDGNNNAAFGVRPMELNTSGGNNTAIGNLALSNSQTTSDHVCVGRLAGSGLTTANNNIIIGHFSGVHPDPAFGQISDRCFIDNIHGAPVSSNFDPQPVMVDSAGRLGTFVLAADAGGFSPKQGIRPQAIPDDTKQAKLNLKVEKLQATVGAARETNRDSHDPA